LKTACQAALPGLASVKEVAQLSLATTLLLLISLV